MLGHGQLTPPTANLCLQRLTPLVLDTITHLTLRRDPWGQQAFPEISAFREFLHQLPSLQSISLVHCDFNSIGALHPVGVDLPLLRSLAIHVAPETTIDLDLLSRIAKSKSSLGSPLEKVKLVFGSATRVIFVESEVDRLKENVQVVEIEGVDENNIPSVFLASEIYKACTCIPPSCNERDTECFISRLPNGMHDQRYDTKPQNPTA